VCVCVDVMCVAGMRGVQSDQSEAAGQAQHDRGAVRAEGVVERHTGEGLPATGRLGPQHAAVGGV